MYMGNMCYVYFTGFLDDGIRSLYFFICFPRVPIRKKKKKYETNQFNKI